MVRAVIINGIPIVQYLAMVTGNLNVICSGMVAAWTSPSLPRLLSESSLINVTDDQGSWLAVICLIGGVVGSVTATLSLDRFGRKKIILLSSLPYFICWTMVAFVESVELLLVARFIGGISDGLVFCALSMYLSEISDAKIRGFMGSTQAISFILGMLLINVIGSYLSISTTAFICVSLPILLLLTFTWMPESPYYLIMKNDMESARTSLKRLKGLNDVETELNRLKKAIEEDNKNSGRYLDMFTVKSNRRALIAVTCTRFVQQFSGPMAIMFYCQVIFQEAGGNISPIVASIIYFSVQLTVSTFSTLIVDRTGRRPLMFVSLIGVALALSIESGFFLIKNVTDIDTSSYTVVSLIGLVMYVTMHSMGIQTIPYLLLGELFPTNIKAFAIGFADIYFCTITTIVSKLFQFTKDSYGLHVPFLLFLTCTIVGLILIIFTVPETKGKTLEEIQEELKGGKRNNTIDLKTIKVST